MFGDTLTIRDVKKIVAPQGSPDGPGIWRSTLYGFSGTPLAYTHKGCQVIFCSDIHILAILMVLGFGSVPSAHASEMGLQPLFDSLNHNIDLQCICGGP